MTKIFAAVVMTIVALAAFAPKAAQAEELFWTITSEERSTVHLEFYSQDQRRAWPGNNRVVALSGSGAQSYNLECDDGELICYGAWLPHDANIYWGVGVHGQYDCATCCATCGAGNVEPIVLSR